MKLLCRRRVGFLPLVVFNLSVMFLQAQIPIRTPLGLAWAVRGLWHLEGKGDAIHSSDAIPPGSLLQPGGEAGDHSIIILLPDGQRVLYECFLAADCARGFRVPSLYRRPDPFAVNMLARIRAVVARENHDSSSGPHQAPRLAPDETMAVMGPGNRVEIAGLAATLSNGRYTYDLRPFDHAYPRQSGLVLDKRAASITFPLPAPGLYELTIADSLNRPRIDLLVAAVRPAQTASLMKSFRTAKTLLENWNGNYQGWPIHDFQRAYLESLMMGVKPLGTSLRADATAHEAHRPGVTSEPAFSPNPGVFDGDTEVTLRCDTLGATIHYTVDGSQPLDSSPVYHAPIVVKGTELTIKAFANAPGRKDSAVVTGIFRIRE